MNNKFINSVCFIRKYGRPNAAEKDIYRSLQEQIKLNTQYGFPATYLLQYDALTDKGFQELVFPQKQNHAEIGCWFEVVAPLVEKAGLSWRGREGWIWDYHVDPGFLMSYPKAEKKKIIDAYMKEFKTLLGEYPKTVGSWLIDSESMEYMSEKYKVDAFILCREQWGMDGYTLWGGPHYGAYYPCKNNSQCPAQTQREQINTPVFRMFVNDPLYCYYEHDKMKYNKIDCGLFTQEPAWRCGQDPEWVKWAFDSIYQDKNVGFEYLQLGQESSFEWENRVEKGMPMQCEFVKENAERYGYETVTVGEMGKRFKKEFSETPITARIALTDWANKGNKTVWFNNKNYRINLYSDTEKVWIRDIHLFSEQYRDLYLDTPCTTHFGIYDNLPIVDGVRFSDDTVQAGIFLGNGRILDAFAEDDYYAVILNANDKVLAFRFYEDRIELLGESTLHFVHMQSCPFITDESETAVSYVHHGLHYSMNLKKEEEKTVFTFSLVK